VRYIGGVPSPNTTVHLRGPGVACPSCGAPLALGDRTLGSVSACARCRSVVALVLTGKAGVIELSTQCVRARPDDLPAMIQQRFKVVGPLGGGGEGLVLRVRPLGAARDYALKLAAGEDTQPMVLTSREARIATLLAHDCTVVPLQMGQADGLRFTVQDLVDGEDLASLLKRERPLAIERALEITFQIGLALTHVHRQGYVHCDVKPDNILLDRAGAVRLTDFGITMPTGTWPKGGMIAGTPGYMAPEQIRAEAASPRFDVYALGCVVYEMICGTPPFGSRDPIDLFEAHIAVPPEPMRARRTDVPAALDDLVCRWLAKDPRDRPPDGAALVAELACAARAAGLPEPCEIVPRDGMVRSAPRGQRSLPWRELALASGLLALSACLALPAYPYGGLLASAATAAAMLVWVSGMRRWARATLGDERAFWRIHMVWRPEVEPVPVGITSTLAVLLMAMMFLAIDHRSLWTFWLWLVMFSGPGLVRGSWRMISSGGEDPVPEDGATELLVLPDSQTWRYSLSPAGASGELPSRLMLAPGLNRLELWRHGGAHRVYSVWGGRRPAHQWIRIDDESDGPRLFAEPALPAPRLAALPELGPGPGSAPGSAPEKPPRDR
jgi:hypothetical protein